MLFERYSRQAAEAILDAEQLAIRYKHADITPEHLLLVFLQSNTAAVNRWLQAHTLSSEILQQTLTSHLERAPLRSLSSLRKPGFHSNLLALFRWAEKRADTRSSDTVETRDLLKALQQDHSGLAARLLRESSAKKRPLKTPSIPGKSALAISSKQPTPPKTAQVQAQTSTAGSETSALEQFGRNWTREVLEQTPLLVERHEPLRAILQILGRRTKNNPLLVGEPGVGRSSIVRSLALRLAQGQAPPSLANQQLIALDTGALLAGTKYRGDLEERFQRLLRELAKAKDQVILVLPELHEMLRGGGGAGSFDASRLLKPALLRGELRCIGLTTPAGVRQTLERDIAFQRLFQTVEVNEPDEHESLLILRGVKTDYEQHHGVRITDEALKAAISFSKRYLPERKLPDKALDLVDEAASRLALSMESMPPALERCHRELVELRMEEQALQHQNSADTEELQVVIEAREQELQSLEKQWQQEKQQVVELQILHDKISALHETIEQKTEQGEFEEAAELKFSSLLPLEQQQNKLQQARPPGRAERLVREVMEEQDIAEVIADWTGIPTARMLESERHKLLRMEERLRARVKGQDEAVHALATAIRRSRSGLSDPTKPIGSFLFLGSTGVGKTELAKALAEFLFDDEQSMIRLDMSEFMEKQAALRLTGAPPGYVGYDEGGQLTEAVRRQPYAVVLFDEIEKAHPDVFNLLLQVLDDGHLTDSQGRKVDFKNTVVLLTSNLGAEQLLQGATLEALRPLLQTTMRPELLNRFDEILCFRPLSEDVLKEILSVQLLGLQRLLTTQGLTLQLEKEAEMAILAAGTDPAFGARPLKRALVQLVQNPLSMKLLEGQFSSGDTILVRCEQQELIFERQSENHAKSVSSPQENSQEGNPT